MSAAPAPSITATEDAAPGVVRHPQVNLLPSEIAAARGLQSVKRWAVLGVAASALVVGVVYAASAVQLGQAQDDLTAAEFRTTQIEAEMAQYADVPLVRGELQQVQQARALATSTEVLWRPQLDALRAALPADASIVTLQVTGATPVASALPPNDPLQPQSLGLLAFTATTPTIPDSAAWVDALGAVPGLVDPRVQSIVQETTEGSAGYIVTGTVQYDETALSGRFQQNGEDN